MRTALHIPNFYIPRYLLYRNIVKWDVLNAIDMISAFYIQKNTSLPMMTDKQPEY